MRIKYIIPFPISETDIEKRAEQIPMGLIPAGVEIDFVPVRNSALLADSAYEGLLLDMFILEAGQRAEEEGFDAVCIDTASDSGMLALRSRLSIPVVGPGLVACHVASMLGRRFSVVSLFSRWADNVRRNLVSYELDHKAASFRSLTDVVPDIRRLMGGKDHLLPEIEKLCRLAIDEDGADVIVLASTTMHEVAAYLKPRLEVPVINPGIWGFRMAVDLAELSVSHSKRAYPSPGTAQDEIFASLPSAASYVAASVKRSGSGSA